jgi:hypothetical protein
MSQWLSIRKRRFRKRLLVLKAPMIPTTWILPVRITSLRILPIPPRTTSPFLWTTPVMTIPTRRMTFLWELYMRRKGKLGDNKLTIHTDGTFDLGTGMDKSLHFGAHMDETYEICIQVDEDNKGESSRSYGGKQGA